MLFLQQYKNLFLSFLKNDFSLEWAPDAQEQNNQTEDPSFEESLRQALEDNTLNGEDLAHLEALQEHYSEDKWEVFAETKEWLQSIITEMLQDGYTVNNENDYNALKNIMSIVDSSYKIPDYQDMMSNLPEDNREKFSFVLNDNKDRLLVYVANKNKNGTWYREYHDTTDEYWYIELSNWEFDDSTWNSDFLTSFDDDISDNNEVSMDDVISKEGVQYTRGQRLRKESLNDVLGRESEELKSSELRELITSEWYIKPSPDTFPIEPIPIPENFEDMSSEELLNLKSNIDIYNEGVQEHLDWIKHGELLTELNNLTIDSDIPEWFDYDWEIPSKPEDLASMSIEQLEWLKSNINEYNSQVENFRQEQETQISDNQERQIEEQESEVQEEQEWQIEEQETVAETQALNKAKRFYERVWSTSDSITELQQLLEGVGESLPEYWADGGFWKETFVAIKSFQQKNWLTVDWMAWKETLEALGVEKSLSEFYAWVEESKQEEVEESQIEDNENASFIDGVWENISESYNKVKEWISEIFRINEDIKEFTWVNGRTVNLEFDQSWPSIHVDTPFFDWISDFPLTDLPTNLTSLEDAKLYVENNVDMIKEEYNNQYLDNAVNMVSQWIGSNYNVWNFETADWEKLNVKLHQEKDHDNNFDWAYVSVSTAFVWDWIRDYETKVDLLDSNWWEISREQLQSAIEESISKYKQLEREQQNELDSNEQDDQIESQEEELKITDLLSDWNIEWLNNWDIKEVNINWEKYYLSKSEIGNGDISLTRNMIMSNIRAHVISNTTEDIDPSENSSYHRGTLSWFRARDVHLIDNSLYVLAK